ncbi:MAG TPA: DUF6002 family protein [Solirubrobacteraceae bacterium]|nr:DUF6002 family protein [Solirubrobacteraceae bacterium]
MEASHDEPLMIVRAQNIRDEPHLRPMRLPDTLAHYYGELGSSLRQAGTSDAVLTVLKPGTATVGNFVPAAELPSLDQTIRGFLGESTIAAHDIGRYRDVRLLVLDLMSNAGSLTTKTFASRIIVARAIQHVRAHGESIMIVTPSSANKATAMRDAVARAIASGAVTEEQLRVLVVAPEAAAYKLWGGGLDDEPRLQRMNPVGLWRGRGARETVKSLVSRAAAAVAGDVEARLNLRLWFTLALENYIAADTVRAFFERDFVPQPSGLRVHAHAVSSAFGLLGHDFGRTVGRAKGKAPGYFLVQHLDTPDMVISLIHGEVRRSLIPEYQRRGNLFYQEQDPHFPLVTADVEEVLEPTFYTHSPSTSPAINSRIRSQGGGGIVVSRHECLARYRQIVKLTKGRFALPDDPAKLREWSFVMAMTGVLEGIDRGLLNAEEVIIHASGSYTVDDYRPVAPEARVLVREATDVEFMILDAAACGRSRTRSARLPVTDVDDHHNPNGSSELKARSPISVLSAVDFNGAPMTLSQLRTTATTMLEEHGYVHLVNVPEEFDPVRFCSERGPFVPQYGGLMVGDVRPEQGMDEVYHSGNTRPLYPHTEGYDFEALPPRYIVLWCVCPAESQGGETTLADAYAWLSSLDDQTLAQMRERIYKWKTTDGVLSKGLDLRTEHPLIEDLDERRIVRFSTNNLLYEEGDGLAEELVTSGADFFQATHIAVEYRERDMLIWDNWRMMHARNAFSDRQRHLRRIQIGLAGVQLANAAPSANLAEPAHDSETDAVGVGVGAIHLGVQAHGA